MGVHLPPLLLWVVCEVLGSVGSVSQLWRSQAVCGSTSKVFRYEAIRAQDPGSHGIRMSWWWSQAGSDTGLWFFPVTQVPCSWALTHTGPLAEGHEGAEDTAHRMWALLNGEASLQLQGTFIVHHSEEKAKERVRAQPKLQEMTTGGQFMFWILYLRYLQCSWIIFAFGDRVLLCWTSHL